MLYITNFCNKINITTFLISFKYVFVFLVTNYLVGCSTNQNLTAYKLPKDHKHHFITHQKKLVSWKAIGKLSYQDYNHQARYFGYLNWLKHNENSTIKLYTTLHLRSIELQHKNNRLAIISKDGKKYSSNSTKNTELTTIKQALNSLSLNVKNLNNWLTGIPNPDRSYSLTKQGFNQDNWQIIYEQFQLIAPDNLQIPKKITMEHHPSSPSAKPTIIKVIITNFELK